MIRRYGEPITRHRYQMRPGAYAILPLGGAVLLTHQQEPQPEFQLPAGGIDPGESPLTALHREVLEETGYCLAAPRRLGAFRRFAYMPEYDLWAEKICHVFVAQPTVHRGPPSEPGHTAIWSQSDQAAGLVADEGSRAFLEGYFA